MRRRTLLAAAVAAPLLAACNPEADPPAGPAEDVPDCDFDDLLEGDEDCYGKPPATRKPTPTAQPKKTTAGGAKPVGKPTPKPAPGRTRR